MILVLKIEYDGTNYGGWQIQPNAPTIQEEIQKALIKLVGQKVDVVGSGRTDAGVHAAGQVAHAKLGAKFPIPYDKVPIALNTKLPGDIRILDACFVEFDFHARYDAILREYSYTISKRQSVFQSRFTSLIKYPFEPDLLNKAAEVFIGEHDFTTFSKLNLSTASYKCKVNTCEWYNMGDGRWRMRISADRFVYGMVRSIAGALLDVAKGKRSVEEIQEALEQRDRSHTSPLAPPHGLILEKVTYPSELKIFE